MYKSYIRDTEIIITRWFETNVTYLHVDVFNDRNKRKML